MNGNHIPISSTSTASKPNGQDNDAAPNKTPSAAIGLDSPAAVAALDENMKMPISPEPPALVPSQYAVMELSTPPESPDDHDVWESPIWCSMETTYGGPVTDANMLAWTKPHFKGLTVFVSPEYKPSDAVSWTRLKNDLQNSAVKQGFSLVSKGTKGSDASRIVLICSRGRVTHTSPREPRLKEATTDTTSKSRSPRKRPLTPSECCRFRLTLHMDRQADRYFIKGGQGSALHTNHGTTDTSEATAKRKITWHPHRVTRQMRWRHHAGAVIWFTGLSASGKSTIANEVDLLLHQRGMKTNLLDGDNVRHGLCQDLGFSEQDRAENIRRLGEVAKLMADSGTIVLTAFISPYRADREKVRATMGPDIPFFEIYVKASVATCEQRDPKGLYAKARAGLIKNFTGVDDPYEEPLGPAYVLNSDCQDAKYLAGQLVAWLDTNKLLALPGV